MNFATTNQIIAGIAHLEGRHLDLEAPMFGPHYGFDSGMVFIPVLCLARFWGEDESGASVLSRCQAKLLGGLWDACAPWGYVVVGDRQRLTAYFALPGGAAALGAWTRVLHGVFPGCRVGDPKSTDEILHECAARSHVAALTGNPAVADDSGAETSATIVGPLEPLFRAMRGSRWAYIVIGQPVEEAAIASAVSGIEREEREVASAFLRRSTAEENNNPSARRYIELLRDAHTKYLEGQRGGLWDVQAYLMADSRNELLAGMQALAGALNGPESKPQPVRVRICSGEASSYHRHVPITRLTTREASVLACLPASEHPGFEMREHVQFATSGSESVGARPIAIGCVLHDGRRSDNWFEIALDDLTKHVFVAGVTGSGKTATCQYLLRQLWEEFGIPWLVLEPSAKSEYRRLLNSPLGKDLRIFTIGDETAVPFRINPLEVQRGIHVQAHIDSLLSLFNAAFAWVTPMPVVLSLAMHRVFEDFGWNLASGKHSLGYAAETHPSLTHLIAAIPKVVKELGYDGEVTANLRAGLVARLSNLTLGAKGLMLNSGVSVPMDYLLEKPTILEFSGIGNDEEKALLLGAFLLRLAQYRQTQGLSTKLGHAVLVEEAHRFLAATPTVAGTEQSNPRGKAVEEFCNMLAEIRAYGQGLIVVDQIPAKLAPDVIKNANLKICHRLVAADDRKQVGGCMNLTEPQERFLSTLEPGQAVAFREGREQAFLIAVPNHALHLRYHESTPGTAEIVAHMTLRRPEFHGARTRAPESSVGVVKNQLHPCPGCSSRCCSSREAIVRELLTCDHSAAYGEAMTGGFPALWEFGTTVAQKALEMKILPLDAPYCVVMNLCAIARFGAEDTLRIRRNMEALREQMCPK